MGRTNGINDPGYQTKIRKSLNIDFKLRMEKLCLFNVVKFHLKIIKIINYLF